MQQFSNRFRTQVKAASLVTAGLAGGIGLALSFNHFTDNGRVDARAADDPVVTRTVPVDSRQISLSFAPVARQVQPAVVNIYTARVVRKRQTMGPFFSLFDSQPRVENSLGSGVIVDSTGLVITNNHVVDGADQIVVALADRREYPARLVFAEPRLDLALLRIDPGDATLPVATLGDSDRAEVGDLVLAIGNPFGVGQTVTQGIVSATARTGIGVSDAQFFIQTDAAINQGNSGGALVNMAGDVIGINSVILSGNDNGGSIGLGFAIPSNMVKIFLRGASDGRMVTAWIGAEGEELTSDTARKAGLDNPSAMLVTGVSPDSPAARAGLRAGDIITAIDGKPVTDPSAMRYLIASQPVGGQTSLSVIRNRQSLELDVTLVAPPETPRRQITRLPDRTILSGLSVANLSPALAQELGAGLPERGVVVIEMAAGAPATRTRYPRPGDIIETVNGQPIHMVGDVEKALALSPGRTLFTINRRGQQVECLFDAPAGFGCRAI